MTREQIVAELKHTLNTAGWRHVIVRLAEKKLIEDIDLLTALKRPEGVSDDLTRGRIERTKWFLSSFDDIVREYDNEQTKAKEGAMVVASTGSPYEPDGNSGKDKPTGSPYAPDPSSAGQTS